MRWEEKLILKGGKGVRRLSMIGREE